MRIELQIHQKAIEIVKRYKRDEADLIEILQRADEHRIYLYFKCRNLHEYAMRVLELTESVAFNFIVVARKAKDVPELKQVIDSGLLSVSKARKITSVLTRENQTVWIQKAVELPQRKLEQQVAESFPQEAVPEKLKYVSEKRLNLQLGISENFQKMLRRTQDLESQKRQKSIGFEEALESALKVYLENEDPVIKAERLKSRKNFAVARQVG